MLLIYLSIYMLIKCHSFYMQQTKVKLPMPTKPIPGLSGRYHSQPPSPALPPPVSSSVTMTIASSIGARRSNRNPGSPEEKEFLSKLYLFMKSRQTPINRVPSIGFKESKFCLFFKQII